MNTEKPSPLKPLPDTHPSRSALPDTHAPEKKLCGWCKDFGTIEGCATCPQPSSVPVELPPMYYGSEKHPNIESIRKAHPEAFDTSKNNEITNISEEQLVQGKVTTKELLDEFIEKGADLEHERWAKWQEYLHSKCREHTVNSLNSTTKQYEDIPTGNLIIPRELRNRWERQISSSYSELSEQEKESDRIEVRKYLPLIQELETSIRREVYVELVQDLQHDTYCKIKGEQFKECALCYVERKLSNGIDIK